MVKKSNKTETVVILEAGDQQYFTGGDLGTERYSAGDSIELDAAVVEAHIARGWVTRHGVAAKKAEEAELKKLRDEVEALRAEKREREDRAQETVIAPGLTPDTSGLKDELRGLQEDHAATVQEAKNTLSRKEASAEIKEQQQEDLDKANLSNAKKKDLDK